MGGTNWCSHDTIPALSQTKTADYLLNAISRTHTSDRKNIHMLTSAKGKLGLEVLCTYCIPCKCDKVYVRLAESLRPDSKSI
jgi:hypothetical protein